MGAPYLVSEPTKQQLEQLIEDRRVDAGAAGGSWAVRQLPGGFARFTLPSALATTDASKASCTVDGYWGGPDPGATITAYNLPASTNYIFSGASGHKGLASYDRANAKWWIIQMECP
jgi:hypothetical protein